MSPTVIRLDDFAIEIENTQFNCIARNKSFIALENNLYFRKLQVPTDRPFGHRDSVKEHLQYLLLAVSAAESILLPTKFKERFVDKNIEFAEEIMRDPVYAEYRTTDRQIKMRTVLIINTVHENKERFQFRTTSSGMESKPAGLWMFVCMGNQIKHIN